MKKYIASNLTKGAELVDNLGHSYTFIGFDEVNNILICKQGKATRRIPISKINCKHTTKEILEQALDHMYTTTFPKLILKEQLIKAQLEFLKVNNLAWIDSTDPNYIKFINEYLNNINESI